LTGRSKSPSAVWDRDRSILGRRQHGSAGSQYYVWRSARHGRGPATDRDGLRHPTRWFGAGCFAHLCRLGARRHRDGMACRVVRHALDRHRVRTDDRAGSGSCLQRLTLPALCLQPGAAGPDRRRRDVLANPCLCHAVVRPSAWFGGGVGLIGAIPRRRGLAGAPADRHRPRSAIFPTLGVTPNSGVIGTNNFSSFSGTEGLTDATSVSIFSLPKSDLVKQNPQQNPPSTLKHPLIFCAT
jgi:hypothetical protein